MHGMELRLHAKRRIVRPAPVFSCRESLKTYRHCTIGEAGRRERGRGGGRIAGVPYFISRTDVAAVFCVNERNEVALVY